jgi:hypothetical protein
MYEHQGNEFPTKFWLMSDVKDITKLDDFLLEVAFQTESILLKSNCLKDIQTWLSNLSQAKDFKVSKSLKI